MVLICGGEGKRSDMCMSSGSVSILPSATYQFSSVKSGSVTQSLDVSRYRVAQKSEHLSDREADSQTMVPVTVASNETPEATESHDRLWEARGT